MNDLLCADRGEDPRIVRDHAVDSCVDDTLEVVTTLTSATGSRIQLDQAVTRDGETLFQSTVTLVCVDIRVMRAHRMPPALIGALGG